MYKLPLPPVYAVFVDTNALYSKRRLVHSLPDADSSLAYVHYFVPQLVISERAVQLVEQFSTLRSEVALFEHFGTALQSQFEPSLQTFSSWIEQELRKDLKVATMEVLKPIDHTSAAQNELFEARHKASYKDTILLDLARKTAQTRQGAYWIFVSNDQQLREAFRALRNAPAFEFHDDLAQLRDRLKINQSVYSKIVASLLPKFQLHVLESRQELLNRATGGNYLLGPAEEDLASAFRRGDIALDCVETDVYDLSVGVPNSEKSLSDKVGYQPAHVLCLMTARFHIPNRWGRLYQAQGKARLEWNQGDLVSTEVVQFEISWAPFA